MSNSGAFPSPGVRSPGSLANGFASAGRGKEGGLSISPDEALTAGASPALADPLVPTIFHEPWWLDIVTRGRWECVQTVRAGRVVGRMIYFRKARLWFETSRMPMLTHFLGPAIDEGEGSASARMLHRHAITRDLIGQIPDLAAFSQKMHGDIGEVIEFQKAGFETNVQFTFELAPASAADLWAGMRDKTRNAARKAEKSYSVIGDVEPETFSALYRANLAAHGWEDFLDMYAVEELLRHSRARGCGRIWAARNAAGKLMAAIACVWDRKVCYYLLSTRSPDSGNGAVTLLLWQAIQAAAAAGLVFDFDGLGYVGAVLFYTGFGAQVRPRYIVSRTHLGFRLLRECRRLISGPDNHFT